MIFIKYTLLSNPLSELYLVILNLLVFTVDLISNENVSPIYVGGNKLQ